MKELLVYTAARLAIFVVSFALALGLFQLLDGGDGVDVLWPLLLAALVSAVASAYLLRGARERVAARVQARAERSVAANREAEGGS